MKRHQISEGEIIAWGILFCVVGIFLRLYFKI
jgi:hypothetical protein